ncbi:MAG: Trm112 family protein [Candidatus Thorarchaeota archaeon]
MKPWLFDILACPIDKHFPLKLYIFSFETSSNDFKNFMVNFEKRDLEIIEAEQIFEISEENGNILIKDNIIIEKTPLMEYINLILMSINELDNIFNKTDNKQSQQCFEMIHLSIKPKIQEFSNNFDPTKLSEVLPELYFLNKVKIETEIQSGLLLCQKCNRWYPIIDSIPQMLPDEFRKEENEIEFLQNHRNLLDEKFFNQDLKPFSI